jgi:hypothetical protein
MQPRVFASVMVPIGAEGSAADRQADIVVTGLEQAGGSFELRVFLNNPRADAGTEPVRDTGYAGSIYVYGYGRPPGEARERAGPEPRIPMTRRVNATDAIRAAAAAGPEVTVTLVPLAFQDPGPDIDLGAVQVSILAHE